MSDTPLNIKPTFQSNKSDGTDATQIQPSQWNAGQVVSGGSDGQLLAYDSAQASHVVGTTSPHVVGVVYALSAPPSPVQGQAWFVQNGSVLEEYMRLNGANVLIRTVTP